MGLNKATFPHTSTASSRVPPIRLRNCLSRTSIDGSLPPGALALSGSHVSRAAMSEQPVVYRLVKFPLRNHALLVRRSPREGSSQGQSPIRVSRCEACDNMHR
jgi:hypothetical protein